MVGVNNERFKELDISESKKFLKYLGSGNKPSNFKWDDIYSLYCLTYRILGSEVNQIADWKNLINQYTYAR